MQREYFFDVTNLVTVLVTNAYTFKGAGSVKEQAGQIQEFDIFVCIWNIVSYLSRISDLAE